MFSAIKPYITGLFDPRNMVKPEKVLGEIEDARTIYSLFFKVAFPAILESALAALTGVVDTIMVGGISDAAISTVGITTQPRMLFYFLFFSINIGVTAVISRKKGEGDRKAANECMHQMLVFTAVMSLVMGTLFFMLSEPLLRLAGAGDDILKDAVDYYRITLAGIMVYTLVLIINASQRSVSKTKITLLTAVAANVVNIVFNYFLINGHWFFPRLEVRGAALATSFGYIAAAIVAFISVRRPGSYLHLSFRELLKWRPHYIKTVWKISVGSLWEQIFMRVGFFMFAKVVAELGTNDFATHQISMTIINLSFAAGDGLGVAASALVGQNLGRKRSDMSEIYGKAAQRIGLLFSAVLFVLFFFFGERLTGLFTDTPEIIKTGGIIMMILAFVSPAQISQVIFSGCLRGAGDTKFMAYVSTVSICIIRPLFSYLLCWTFGLGVAGAWWALLFDQYLRFALSAGRFYKGKWKLIKIN